MPDDGATFTFDQFRALIGCTTIELVPLGTTTYLVLDEDGKLKGLPRNDRATFEAVAANAIADHDEIVGHAILCPHHLID